MSFLSRLLGRPAAPDSSIASVTYDDVGVTRQHAGGRVDEVDWADLREVAVMARVDGRGRPDPHVVLTGRKASTIVNARVQGIGPLVERLGRLPKFDQAAFDQAASATDRSRTVCWRRAGVPTAAPDAAAGAAAPAAASKPLPAPVSGQAEVLEFELVPLERRTDR
jgi:hypothetical protein